MSEVLGDPVSLGARKDAAHVRWGLEAQIGADHEPDCCSGSQSSLVRSEEYIFRRPIEGA